MIAALVIAAAIAATNAPSAVVTEGDAMPRRMVSVWQQAELEHRRTADLLASGAIDAAEAVRRRAAIRRAFVRVCRARGVPEETIAFWQGKMKF